MYCIQFESLVDLNFAASTRYFAAVSRLSKLPGMNRLEFAEVKADCQECREECMLTMLALDRHRTTCGCRGPASTPALG